MKRLGKVGHCLSIIVGTFLGSFCFLLLATLITAKPVRDTILSAHGVLIASKPTPLTFEQNAVVMDLLQRGALISSNDLLSNMSSFYSTTIQILIATFFVFGALSFFAVQANARRQIEDVADANVSKATANHFGSMEFDRQIREKIDSSLQIELESYESRIVNLEQTNERVNELEGRVRELSEIQKLADAEE
jgi:hypothetical protein